MIKEFEKIVQITSDSKVELAQSFKDLMHKKLQLGQSRFVCRHGTLSEGHDKLLDSQRYFQAIKESFYLSINMLLQRAVGMEAYADLLEAEQELLGESVQLTREADQIHRLRIEARILKAKQKMLSALTTVEDQERQLDEYMKIEAELRDQVDAKYPGGIEEAERDHWRAIAEYRARNRALGIPEQTKNIPLSPEDKAELGYRTGNNDMTTWYLLRNKDALLESGGDIKAFLQEKFGDRPKLIERPKEVS